MGDLVNLQKILGRTSLDVVRRYVNLDTVAQTRAWPPKEQSTGAQTLDP